ncbi:hypothetical protein EXU34_22380 [Alteromonas sp. ZYF713]|nr:hypothetical protein [Alteromonas sp. ZYF713]
MLSRFLIILFFIHVSASQAGEVYSKNWYMVGESAIAINTNTLESELERFLETQPKGLLLPLNEYTFQYALINESKLEIHGICLDIPERHNLKEGFLMVADGGNCFFSIEFNIDTKRFSNLHINGIA